MQKIHDLGERFLCLLLTGHILKAYSRFILRYDSGSGFAEIHDISERSHRPASGALRQRPHHQLPEYGEDDKRKNPCKDKVEQRTVLLRNLRAEFYIVLFQPGPEIIIRKYASLVKGRFAACSAFAAFRHEYDLAACIIHHDFFNLIAVHHLKKCAVVHFLYLPLQKSGEENRVCHHQDQQYADIILQYIPAFSAVLILVTVVIKDHIRPPFFFDLPADSAPAGIQCRPV